MKKKTTNFNLVLAAFVLVLTIFGVVMVYDTSVVVAHETFGDKLFLFKNQLIWALAGILVGFTLSHLDYHRLRNLARSLFIVSIILLVVVLIPGFSVQTYGARRRLSLPLGLPALRHINLQPSELAKLSFIIYLAHFLEKAKGAKKSYLKTKRRQVDFFKDKASLLTPFLSLTGLLMGLIVLEPDLGTALIVGSSSFLVYFLSGANLIEIFLVDLMLALGGLVFALTSEYRYNRLLAFFNSSQDKLGVSYHVNQLLIALGSGGLLGLGLGHSRQKYQYLPESYTDSIFAIIGEESGFLGAMVIVGLLFLVVWQGLGIARRAPDEFGKLLAGGLTGLIGIQTAVNLGSVVGLLPLTGVPLPFISYGGSSLTILLAGVGILLNISKQAK